jgi:hypothetical protein
LNRSKITITLFLAFMLMAGTTTTISVYAQSNSSPFVTHSQLQAALATVVTDDELQAALATVVTQEQL